MGSRDFHYKNIVYGALDKAHCKRGITQIIIYHNGGCEYLAKEWAQENSVDVLICNRRPEQGAPEAAIVFGDGEKPGGVPVWVVKAKS
jgi:hypothetical protein